MSDFIHCYNNITHSDIRTAKSSTSSIFSLNLHNLSSSEAILTTVAVGLLIQLLSVLFNIIRKFVHKRKADLDIAFDAGGQVSTSLTVTSLVASWTWSVTLLESTTVTSKYGVSGAFWYAAGACVQILLFSILAVQFKIRAPGAKTFLQVIRCRFGKTTHIIFSVYALLTNVFVLGMLTLGGSQAMVTVVNDYSIELATIACATIIGANCLTGGLGAKFYASYFQSCGIFIIILLSNWKLFVNGSISSIYESLKCLESKQLFENNNVLGMGSLPGFTFGVINLVGNFGAMFADQVYWQSAVASKPKQAVKGFLLAGIVWFSVPFSFATVMGLTYLDLSVRNGGHILNDIQINEGLVAVAVTTVTAEKTGKLFLFIILILAVTSTGASEVIAIDSIIIYDFYMTYLKPFRLDHKKNCCILCGKPTKGKITQVCSCEPVKKCRQCKLDVTFNATRNNSFRRSNCETHGPYRDYANDMNKKKSWCMLVTSVSIVPLTILLFALGIKMSWIYLFMGVIIGSEVVPIILSLYWSRLNHVGMICGSLGGTTFGLVSWLVAASQYNGGLRNFFQNTGRENVMLIGNLMSIISSAIFTIVLSIATNKKSKLDIEDGWKEAKNIDNPLYPWKDLYKKEIKEFQPVFQSNYLEMMFSKEKRLAICVSLCITFLMLFVWPLVWYSFGTFDLMMFTVWVSVAIVAALVAALYLIFAPLYEEINLLLKAVKKYSQTRSSTSEENENENENLANDSVRMVGISEYPNSEIKPNSRRLSYESNFDAVEEKTSELENSLQNDLQDLKNGSSLTLSENKIYVYSSDV